MKNLLFPLFFILISEIATQALENVVRQGAVVQKPSIVINPTTKEAYMVIPGPGTEAFVYFPKEENYFLTEGPLRISPRAERILRQMAMFPNNPLQSDSGEVQLAMHLLSLMEKSKADDKLLALLLGYLAAGQGVQVPGYSDAKLEEALVKKLTMIKEQDKPKSHFKKLVKWLLKKLQHQAATSSYAGLEGPGQQINIQGLQGIPIYGNPMGR